MNQETKRAVTVLVAAAGVLAVAGAAMAAASPAQTGRTVVAAPDVDVAPGGDEGKKPKPGFYETYRGHHIMGWGAGDSACAYIDGKRLVLYPAEDGKYTSAIQGFNPQVGVRNITKASVKALGTLKLTNAEPSSTCPEFAPPKPATTPAPKATTATPKATATTPSPTATVPSLTTTVSPAPSKS
ncbi:MAG TPA: tyrosinase family oxidase copper chaperone [Actinoplanes sp.]|nr:tyrosinase family oxidase copper chaperone [Actinoplanes sp.]